MSGKVYNVNKGVFCLIISYLRIQSYNVLNYNNCSTDWNFPLRFVQVCDSSTSESLYKCLKIQIKQTYLLIVWLMSGKLYFITLSMSTNSVSYTSATEI
jgi:hypothetical protein